MAINFSKLFGRAAEPEVALGGPDTAAAHDRYANMEVSYREQPAPAEGVLVWNGEPVSQGTLNVHSDSPQHPEPLGFDRGYLPPDGVHAAQEPEVAPDHGLAETADLRAGMQVDQKMGMPDFSSHDNLRSSAPPPGLLPYAEQSPLFHADQASHTTPGEAGEGASTLLDFSHGDATAAADNGLPVSLNFGSVEVIGDHAAGGHEAGLDGHHGALDHGHHGLADHHIDFDL
ncbi:MAG: hypothetical protein WBO97_15660 [Tepidiformaceae bacterium]